MENENTQEKKLISKEGMDKYIEELNFLKGKRRKEVAAKIRDAREQGDLSENGEYDAAKDEQREIEIRIMELEDIMKNYQVIDKNDLEIGKIGVGTHVKLFDVKEEEELEYDIVGATEADSLKGRISNESPLGAALIGKQKGDIVEIPIARGKLKMEILEVV